MRFSQWFQSKRAETPFPLSQGLYRFPTIENSYHITVHLRVEAEQHASLILNGNTILQLNPTATWMTYLALYNVPASVAAQKLSILFSTSRATIERDYRQLSHTIHSILGRGHLCFHDNPEVETLFPFQYHPSAPYRMDLALTYQCNNQCFHCYNDPNRTVSPLSIEQWKAVIDRIWELGIPHIVFTGGEPTLVEGLTLLIEYAKQKGLITGLNTNGRRLSDIGYAQSLHDAGLDHIQITLESANPTVHDRIVQKNGAWKQTITGIQNALKTQCFVMTNTTLLRENFDTLPQTLNYLAELGVPTIGLNALIYSGKGCSVAQPLTETELFPLLKFAQDFVEQSGQKLIWYTPTHYCNFDPMSLNLGVKGCTAALFNLCIEPNGEVLPCQSYYQSLGNFLIDDWESIWHHPLAEALRTRQYISEQCGDCLLLSQCGGGCPLAPTQINWQTFFRMEA
ncbi:MAG: hypothetical protein DDG59_00310 [Anaerolineae bacterium]|jgi:radical SAM protein with 4Fe4S-binding SPASM domain|nr:MAG: hypothetical protein DDG59_00310 [Anaerolineae bacterium]